MQPAAPSAASSSGQAAAAEPDGGLAAASAAAAEPAPAYEVGSEPESPGVRDPRFATAYDLLEEADGECHVQYQLLLQPCCLFARVADHPCCVRSLVLVNDCPLSLSCPCRYKLQRTYWRSHTDVRRHAKASPPHWGTCAGGSPAAGSGRPSLHATAETAAANGAAAGQQAQIGAALALSETDPQCPDTLEATRNNPHWAIQQQLQPCCRGSLPACVASPDQHWRW